jgi:alpha-maltose-1-phosphate synthase
MTGTARTALRVAHIVRKYNPSEWGGMETHVDQVTRRLALLGWRPEIHAPQVASGSGAPLDSTVPVQRFQTVAPYLGSARKRRVMWESGNVITLDEPLRLLWDRGLPLVHLHTAGRIGGAVRAALRLTKRPYVVSIHGPLLTAQTWQKAALAERASGAVDLGRPFGLLVGARRVLDDAARLITFNEEERVAMTARYGDRVLRMDQGVDAERLEAGDAQRARERWPQLARGPVLTVVGRLSEVKNQLLALQAFARGAPPEAQLVLAGATVEPAYREGLERECRALGLGGRVHFLGNLEAVREVPDLLALTTLMLVPSHFEAFGLVVLEAWAAGCPVLMATHFGLAVLAQAIGEPGLFARSQEPEAWAAAVRECLASPERREASVRAGRAVVRQRFGWEAVARRLGDVYLEVLEEGARRVP